MSEPTHGAYGIPQREGGGVLSPQPGDFKCVPTGGFGGKAISVAEWLDGSAFGEYDHAYIFVGNPGGMKPTHYGYKVQAEPNGATCVSINTPGDSGLGGTWSTGHITLTYAQRDLIVKAALKYVGVPYSFLDYLALVEHRLHIPAPGLKNYIASTGHMICSQLVDQCYLDAGVHLFDDGRWPGYVTPADLAALLK